MTNDAEKRLTQFKEDLTRLSPIEMVRKHIISGECCFLSQRQYFNLRSEVADHFGLHPNECTARGFLDHSLKEDCAIMTISIERSI